MSHQPHSMVLDATAQGLNLAIMLDNGLRSELAKHVDTNYGLISSSSTSLSDVVEIKGKITVSF